MYLKGKVKKNCDPSYFNLKYDILRVSIELAIVYILFAGGLKNEKKMLRRTMLFFS